MAVTVSSGTSKGRQGDAVFNARKSALLYVTFSNSYPAGGEVFDLKQYLGWTPAAVFVTTKNSTNVGHVVKYDPLGKLRAFSTAAAASGLTEVTAATDLSGLVVALLAVGD